MFSGIAIYLYNQVWENMSLLDHGTKMNSADMFNQYQTEICADVE